MTLPKDKLLHFGGGVVIYVFSFFVFENHLAALGITTFIGAAKEIRDYFGYGTPEVMDFAATFAGGLIIYLLANL